MYVLYSMSFSVGQYQKNSPTIVLSAHQQYHDILTIATPNLHLGILTITPLILQRCVSSHIRDSYLQLGWSFLDKNTNMYRSGFSRLCLRVTTFPDVLNSRSEPALLAQMARYL